MLKELFPVQIEALPKESRRQLLSMLEVLSETEKKDDNYPNTISCKLNTSVGENLMDIATFKIVKYENNKFEKFPIFIGVIRKNEENLVNFVFNPELIDFLHTEDGKNTIDRMIFENQMNTKIEP